jgi:predicted DCC family thiol-disulfide oxidoreductase YuxK
MFSARPVTGQPPGTAGRLTVLYDARCRVCTRIAGRLAGLDRDRRLRLVPLQQAATDRPEVRRLRAERDLRQALHVIDEDGRWASGGEAVIRALEGVPSLRPLARLARLPIARSLVEPGYRLFAANRARFSWLAGSFRRVQRPRISGRARSRSRGHGGSARSR